ANSFWPQFGSFLISATELSDEALREHPQTAKIQQFFAQSVKGLAVLKIKIYDLQGRTVFSSEAKQIGENKSNNAGFMAARSEVAASELTHRDKFRAFEGVIENRDLLSSYIPVRRDGASGPVEAVFELYYDVTELLADMRRTERQVIFGVVILLGVLYGVLFLIVRHAEKVMATQGAERERAEQALAVANQRLEKSLEELSGLYAAMTPLAVGGSVNDVLDSVIDKLISATGADGALVRLWDKQAEQFTIPTQKGFPQSFIEAARFKGAGSAVDQAFRSGAPIIAADIAGDERIKTKSQLDAGFRSCAFLPLKVRGEVRGIVHLASCEPGHFTHEQEKRLMAIAHQMGVAIENRELFDKVRATNDSLELTNQKLDQQTRALLRSNAELEQFAYVASHDLQEPLRMITGYTQLLAKRYGDKLGQDAGQFIGFMVDGAKRMRQLIEDILTYSRVDRRGKPLVACEVGPLLDQTLATLQLAIEESGAVVTHDELPKVHADPGQIVQLLQNLLGNAIKYHGDAPPRVHISCQRRGADWLFAVKDNGIGIEAQYAERVFIIFQRLHTREEYEGTGIGLAVCKKIVDRHGGRIWLESTPGQGATFFFTLPAQLESEIANHAALAAPAN
ncbi:MAG: GAF domain-containing protein, partial [Deltaproteobacteria bacterium]|nr:GAF domain-containing protein [Deltaproteobacteria bacterium]